MLVETRTTNKNTGPTDFMEDAKAVNHEIRDLVQGSRPHNGYITLIRDEGLNCQS
jgi:hypothetical protein